MGRGFQTPLRRARGSGSVHEGTGHFLAQRITAVFSILLAAFVMVLAVVLAGSDYDTARAVAGNPFVATGLLATAATFVYHMMIGMQVIIEDYVHGALARPLLLAANVLFCGLVFVLSALAIAKIAFGA